MKKSFLCLIAAIILFVSTASGAATRPIRVKFKKGATTATVSGSLRNYKDSKEYVIRVREGQTMTIEQARGASSLHYVTLGITDPNGEDATDMEANCNNNKTIENTRAGDYKIRVAECGKADEWRGAYKLKITVK